MTRSYLGKPTCALSINFVYIKHKRPTKLRSLSSSFLDEKTKARRVCFDFEKLCSFNSKLHLLGYEDAKWLHFAFVSSYDATLSIEDANSLIQRSSHASFDSLNALHFFIRSLSPHIITHTDALAQDNGRLQEHAGRRSEGGAN